MLPNLPFQLITIAADLLIFIFVGYYLLQVRAKEKTLEKKEGKIDTDYHKIVDNALAKERKILEDATTEADQIIAGTQYVSKTSKETIDQAFQKMVADIQQEALATTQAFMMINKSSKETVEHALQQLLADVQKEALATNQSFIQSYRTTLKQIAVDSLTSFHTVTKNLESDLQKQTKEFHDLLLPVLEKELEAYKETRMKQAEQTITRVIQKASQDILHTTIPLSDHQNLIIESLERAKKEGVFE